MTEVKKIDVDGMPSDLNPDRNPIIAQHFFGWRCIGDVTSGIVRDLQRRRHVEWLHELGPRALDELLIEIGAESSCLTAIEMKLARYASLNRRVVEALDGCELRMPLAVVDGGRR